MTWLLWILHKRAPITVNNWKNEKFTRSYLRFKHWEKRFLCFSPEVVQSQPYGEKADVWASGCILYQMATLEPPFYSSNMLALATKVRLEMLNLQTKSTLKCYGYRTFVATFPYERTVSCLSASRAKFKARAKTRRRRPDCRKSSLFCAETLATQVIIIK